MIQRDVIDGRTRPVKEQRAALVEFELELALQCLETAESADCVRKRFRNLRNAERAYGNVGALLSRGVQCDPERRQRIICDVIALDCRLTALMDESRAVCGADRTLQ